MKKNKFFKTLAIIGMILFTPLIFIGCSNENKTDPQNFRVKDGYVQFTQDGETWTNLIEAEYPISEYDFRINNGYVQWTTDGETWTNLIKTEKEPKTYTITYDYGAAKDLFEQYVPDTSIIEENTWVMDLPQITAWLNEPSFVGWFIKDTDKQITEHDYIAGDITLEARFDFTSTSAPAGLYKNGKYIKTWQQIIDDESIVVEDSVLTYGFVQGDLKIDSTVTKIGDKAFDDNMQWLTGIAMADSVKQIGSRAFDNCIDLKTVIIGRKVEIIGDSAFASCDALRDVIIGEYVQIIDEFAFGGCEKLSNIVIPSSVIMINERAFSSCNNLTTVHLSPANNTTWKIYNEDNNIISQDAKMLTDEQIAWYLYKGYDFRQVHSIYQSGGNYFHYVLTNTKAIIVSVEDKTTIYNEEISNRMNSNPVEIAAYAFANSENLHTVTITEEVEFIGYNAFSGCDELKTINFEEKEGYKWQVYENNAWRDAEASELFDLLKAGKELKRVAE